MSEASELRTQLEAWHAAFGTTQLTHAKERLRVAEAEVQRLTAELAEAKAETATAAKRGHDAAERSAMSYIRQLKDEMAGLDKSLAAARAAVPKWIDVSTQLPEIGTFVLAADVIADPSARFTARYQGEKTWHNGFHVGVRVTHWCHLLPPPVTDSTASAALAAHHSKDQK